MSGSLSLAEHLLLPRAGSVPSSPVISRAEPLQGCTQPVPSGPHHLPHLPEAAACVLQDFQGVVGPLAFAVEFDVAGETFQFYLSKRE